MKLRRSAFTLEPKPRGIHIVTGEIERKTKALKGVRMGLAHVFIQHTSASLTINENADPAVRNDMENHFRELVPEAASWYTHTSEGPDDMPAHIKSSIFGSSVTVPVLNEQFDLGTWQGIYLCEHRQHAGARHLVVTLLCSEVEP